MSKPILPSRIDIRLRDLEKRFMLHRRMNRMLANEVDPTRWSLDSQV
jgi:hypothetical protein